MIYNRLCHSKVTTSSDEIQQKKIIRVSNQYHKYDESKKKKSFQMEVLVGTHCLHPTVAVLHIRKDVIVCQSSFDSKNGILFQAMYPGRSRNFGLQSYSMFLNPNQVK